MKKRNSILIFFALLFLLACNARENNKKQLSKAEKLYEKKEYAKALLKIDSTLAKYPEDYDFIVLKSRVLSALENEDDAINLLKPLLKKNYKLDTLNYLIANCYFGKGKGSTDDTSAYIYKKAIFYCQKAISINLLYKDAYLRMSRCFHNQNQYNRSVEVIEGALKLFPNDVELIAERGIEKSLLGDYKGAELDFNLVIKAKADSSILADVFRFRGLGQWDRNNNREALNDFTTALKYNPQNMHLYANRGNCYLDLGMKDKACEDFSKAVSLGWTEGYEVIRDNCN
jgi:tetratricopeptide (TPR) repeat protein